MRNIPKALWWEGDGPSGHLALLDQTKLPEASQTLICAEVPTLVDAIVRLSVRGAPAIGIAAAYGCVLGARAGDLEGAMGALGRSRPTAVNLFWALDRIRSLGTDDPGRLLDEARAIHEEDRSMCMAIGRNGADPLQRRRAGHRRHRYGHGADVPGA